MIYFTTYVFLKDKSFLRNCRKLSFRFSSISAMKNVSGFMNHSSFKNNYSLVNGT